MQKVILNVLSNKSSLRLAIIMVGLVLAQLSLKWKVKWTSKEKL